MLYCIFALFLVLFLCFFFLCAIFVLASSPVASALNYIPLVAFSKTDFRFLFFGPYLCIFMFFFFFAFFCRGILIPRNGHVGARVGCCCKQLSRELLFGYPIQNKRINSISVFPSFSVVFQWDLSVHLFPSLSRSVPLLSPAVWNACVFVFSTLLMALREFRMRSIHGLAYLLFLFCTLLWRHRHHFHPAMAICIGVQKRTAYTPMKHKQFCYVQIHEIFHI